tara:strand:- start:71 stop:1411 length:1341 start_codon:yes stop_codon:yes gene_type:complete
MIFSIIDVETTGYPKNKITDISIFSTDGKSIIKEFHSLVNPSTTIPRNITRLTGISDETVKDAPKFFEIAKQVLDNTKDSIFVAHNVNFDFNVIKNEYKELGYSFKRKKLCTVKLSRKIIPGYKSYSLGKLCADLKIPIHGRHRAKGDAFATFKLFKLLFEKSNGNLIENEIYNKQLTVSKYLHEKDLDYLPNEIGVYYFWNNDNKIIYVGKSIKIKDRVISHFRNSSKKEIKLCQEATKVTYTITGSDLIAQLLESAEIKKHYPIFNRKQKRIGENYALTYFTNNVGIIELKIDYLKRVTNPLITYEGSKKAKDHLKYIVETNQFCLKYCDLEKGKNSCFYFQIKKCLGICCNKESNGEYNKRVLKFIMATQPKKLNESLFTSGRNRKEIGFVFIENGVYKGFGFIPKKSRFRDNEYLKKKLIKQSDNRDARRIIRSYIKKVNIV